MKQEKDLAINLPVEISAMPQVAIFWAVSVVSFFVPFLLSYPQWLVGTVINAGLFMAVIFLPRKYFLPIAVLPSLGVLARGMVFGLFTWFLIYFLTFIWLGNLILILVFKKHNFIVASFAKFLFLFLVANIYFKFSIVPMIFVQAMGLNQLATALAGGVISLLMFKLYGGFITRNKRIN
jgi:hypothetical protein